MKAYKGKIKELAKNGKVCAIASAVVLTSFGIGYATGGKMTSMKIGWALDAIFKDNPDLEEAMKNAAVKAMDKLTN